MSLKKSKVLWSPRTNKKSKKRVLDFEGKTRSVVWSFTDHTWTHACGSVFFPGLSAAWSARLPRGVQRYTDGESILTPLNAGGAQGERKELPK